MSDPLTGKASEATRDRVARAIYLTHWKPPAPTWENASENVRRWVKAQADAAIAELAAID